MFMALGFASLVKLFPPCPAPVADADGKLARTLATRYRLVDVVAGNRIYRLRPTLPEEVSVP